MKTVRSIILFSLIALGAQAQNSTPEVPVLSPADQTFAEVEHQIQTPGSDLQKLGDGVDKGIKSTEFQSKLAREFAKLKIKIKIDPLGNIFDSEDTDGGTYYQYVIESAFRNDQQIRKDIWVLDMRLGNGAARIGGQVRLTFTRFFSGPDAKRNAAKAPVIWFWEMPTNSNGVKALKDNSGFRFEVLGDIAVGLHESVDKARLETHAVLHYKRTGQFILDIFKHDETHVRARLIGIKNRGEIEGDMGFRLPFVGFLRGKLKDVMSVGIGLKFASSFDFFKEPLTIDTMMTDFLFKLSTPNALSKEQRQQLLAETDVERNGTGEAALDEIFGSIKRGGFASIFLFIYKEKQLYWDLVQKMTIAERLAKSDLQDFNQGRKTFKDLRSYNYFRGTMLSNHRPFEAYAKFSLPLRVSAKAGTVKSYVTSYDENYKGTHFWLNNSFIRESKRIQVGIFETSRYTLNHETDILVHSDEDKNYGPLLDVVVRTQIEDSQMSRGDMEGYRKIIMDTLPGSHKNDPKIYSMLNKPSQTNTYLDFSYSFNETAFKSAGNLNVPELTMKLIDFFQQHPHRTSSPRTLHLPSDGGLGETDYSKIGEGTYLEQKATDIARVFDPSLTSQQRTEAINIAIADPIFHRYLIGEYFPRVIPQQNPDPYFGFDIKFTSAESGTQQHKIGQNRVSDFYDSVAFIRNMINDQSLEDMQLTNMKDPLGGEVLIPRKQGEFLVPHTRVQQSY